MNNLKKGFVKGAALLGSMGIISKIIGAIYTIPTTHIIGPRGMGIYMAAFPVYTFLLAISSAGLPVAISKMVSERIALNDHKAAHMVFLTAIKAMMFIGFVTMALMFIFSQQISNALGMPEANLTIKAIAPSLFFVAMLSAYRGYFQGMHNMAPTAWSQVIEQVVKLGSGLALGYLWVKKGVEYGAAGAILGITISEVVAFIYFLVLYYGQKRQQKIEIRASVRTRLRINLGRDLFFLATPVVIGACAMPFVQTVDAAIINNTLNGMHSIILFGKERLLNSDFVDSLYGLTGFVNPIINMPAVLSMALAISFVPTISLSQARNDLSGMARKAAMGLKLSMLIGLPCMVGLYLLSTPIIHLLYNLGGDLLPTAGRLLAILAISIFFLTILQTMTGILQGLGKTYIPVVNLFIGIAVKIAISLIFIRMPEINIQGSAIGTTACYAVAAVLDTVFVIKHAGLKIKMMDDLVKPMLAAGGMGLVLLLFMPPGYSQNFSRLITVFFIIIAMIVYGILVILFGALNNDDLAYLPGGNRIAFLINHVSPRKKN